MDAYSMPFSTIFQIYDHYNGGQSYIG